MNIILFQVNQLIVYNILKSYLNFEKWSEENND